MSDRSAQSAATLCASIGITQHGQALSSSVQSVGVHRRHALDDASASHDTPFLGGPCNAP